MGILDQFVNMNPEQTNGLLAAASQILQNSGDPHRPFTMGQAMGVGLQAYDSSTEQARRRKVQEEEAKQIAQMRAMQMQEMQGSLQDREAKREQAMRMIALQQKFAQRGQPQDGPSQAGAASPDAALGGSPQMQAPQMQMPQAPQSPYQKAMAYAQFLESEGQVEQALEVAREAQKLKPKYSTTPHTMRAKDGTLRNLQLAEDGSPPVDVGYGVRPDMKELRLGNRIEFADMNEVRNGQQFRMGVDPDTVYSGNIAMRGQNMADARARETIGQGKIPQGYRMLPDGSMAPIPGGPADPNASKEGVQRVRDAQDVLGILDEAEPLLDKATNSYAGAGLDYIGRSVGFATEGAKATAKLKVLQGALVSKMPKMSGPQSDKDVQLYREMAGQIGDPTIPAAQRLEAAKAVRALNLKYAGQNQGAKPAAGGWSIQKVN